MWVLIIMAKQYSTKPPVHCKEAVMRCCRSEVNEQSHERGDSNQRKPIRNHAQEMGACTEGIVFLIRDCPRKQHSW